MHISRLFVNYTSELSSSRHFGITLFPRRDNDPPRHHSRLILIVQLSTTRTSIYVTLLTDLKGFLHCINGYFFGNIIQFVQVMNRLYFIHFAKVLFTPAISSLGTTTSLGKTRYPGVYMFSLLLSILCLCIF